MARYTPNNLTGALAPVNAELEKIKQVFIDTLSRKGDTPNAMESNLDMNSNRILNLVDAVNSKEPVTLVQMNEAIEKLNRELRNLIEGIIEGTLPEGAELTPEQIQSIIDDVTNDVLNSQLLADLNQSIVDVGEDIQSVDEQVRLLIQQVETSLNQSISELGLDVDALTGSLNQSVQDITTDLNAEINRIDNIFGEIDAIDTAIVNETNERISEDEALATSISGLASQYDNLNAQLLLESTTRATADAALVQTINTLQTFSAKIFVQDEPPTIETAPDNAVEGDLWYDSNDGNHPYTLLDDGTGNLVWTSIRDENFQALQAQIQTEQTARIDGDEALSSEIVSLTALVNTNNSNTLAAIQDESTTRAQEDDALATQISTLTANVASDIQTVTAQVNSEATARATADSALAQNISSLTAVVDNNNTTLAAQISSEASARADADQALTNSINSLTSTVDSNTAAITTEQNTRATADSALSSQINTVAASRNRVFYQSTPPTASSTGDLWFESDNNNKPHRWSGSAWVDITDGRVTANAAAITSEQTARINADGALASDIQNVVASVDNNTAAITAEATARSNADSALSTQINNLATSVGENSAAILNEQTARVNADSALASDITTLSSTVGDNTAAIQTTSSVVDGIKTQYMVKLDSNGYVSGFGLYNEGSSSEFVVLADRFAVVTPGENPVNPFTVTANGVFIQDAFIENLNASKINGQLVRNQLEDNIINGVKLEDGAVTADKIFANSITADKILAGEVTADKLSADAIYGKRSVVTTGNVSVVTDPGTTELTSDLIMWVGPSSATTAASRTKQNGIFWIASDGSKSREIERRVATVPATYSATSSSWQTVATLPHETLGGLCEISFRSTGWQGEVVSAFGPSQTTLRFRVIDGGNNVLATRDLTLDRTEAGSPDFLSTNPNQPLPNIDFVVDNSAKTKYVNQNYRLQMLYDHGGPFSSVSVTADFVSLFKSVEVPS